jgi:twitching motility protein PilT
MALLPGPQNCIMVLRKYPFFCGASVIMAKGYSLEAKVYASEEGKRLSILDLLRYFQEKGAMRVSDLHIKVGAPPTYRVNGDLQKLKGASVTNEIAEQLIYPLLSDEHLAALESQYSVDCSYRLGNLQFRINVFQENNGICAAIRALTLDIPPVENIGFPNNVWEDIVERKQGLVLLTGITGAGKSTTIAALIDRICQNRACRIITIEDPIEYIYLQKNSLISQRELGRDVKSFADGLRAMLREDPDVIFVGEMRDPETISMTLMAAETGHLVFSTLHTRDVTGTITRILDYFSGGRQNEVRNQLSLGLRYIICQKLIPKKDGSGRIVAMEIFNNNYACANIIRIGKVEQIYSQLQTKTKNIPEEKMITMEAHLARLIKAEQVDLLEGQKWANNVKCFTDCLKREA